MNALEARYRIITPMFMAGADQSKAELRVPSIKGTLMFWWRALNWNSFYQNETGSDRIDKALSELHRQEALLFGSAGNEGQSKALFQINKVLSGTLGGDDLLQDDPDRKYLGYGLFSTGTTRERCAIQADEEFSITVRLKRGITEDQVSQIKKCTKALGMFGGLGSRSRNGFGSVALMPTDDFNAGYNSIAEYEKALGDLLGLARLSDDCPPFTAFSHNSRLFLGGQKYSAVEAHRCIGDIYKEFRKEHQKIKRNRYFGLPLKVEDERNRRSSPLIFHVHQIGNQYVPLITYLPSDFHPHPDYSKNDYSLVEEFLESLQEHSWKEVI